MSAGESRGWPPELTFLLERHPRATWPAARTPTVAFWLEVHEHLRRDAAGLEAASDDYRRGRTAARELAVIAAPRLRGLVASLHGHHQIEDFHYFPVFRRHEPRLGPGFERLEGEHADLAREIAAARAALAQLQAAAAQTAPSPSSALLLAADRYLVATRGLCEHLLQHLADEEALVVPVLMEHGAG